VNSQGAVDEALLNNVNTNLGKIGCYMITSRFHSFAQYLRACRPILCLAKKKARKQPISVKNIGSARTVTTTRKGYVFFYCMITHCLILPIHANHRKFVTNVQDQNFVLQILMMGFVINIFDKMELTLHFCRSDGWIADLDFLSSAWSS